MNRKKKNKIYKTVLFDYVYMNTYFVFYYNAITYICKIYDKYL